VSEGGVDWTNSDVGVDHVGTGILGLDFGGNASAQVAWTTGNAGLALVSVLREGDSIEPQHVDGSVVPERHD